MSSSPLISWLFCAAAIASVPSAVEAQFGLSSRTNWPGPIFESGAGVDDAPAFMAGWYRWTERAPVGIDSQSPWILSRIPATDLQVHRVSYPVETGSLRVIPAVAYVADPGARVPGVLSLGLERSAPGSPWAGKAGLDWSGKAGGAVQLDYRSAERQVAVGAGSRPAGVIALPDRRAPGTTVDGVWTERLGARTTAEVALADNRLYMQGHEPEAGSGRMELQHRATDGVSLIAQVAGSSYADATGDEIRRSTVAVGTAIDGAGLSFKATVRDQTNSANARSGRGGRVSLRGGYDGWTASMFADAQQQASTVALDVSGLPDLPRDIADVGLLAANPESAVQLARDRSFLLAQHGVALGALRLDPLRVLGGLDVKWRDGARRTEIGMRLAMDELDGIAGTRRAVLGNLYASWRIFRDADMTASYASWSMQREQAPDDNRSVLRLLVRAPL